MVTFLSPKPHHTSWSPAGSSVQNYAPLRQVLLALLGSHHLSKLQENHVFRGHETVSFLANDVHISEFSRYYKTILQPATPPLKVTPHLDRIPSGYPSFVCQCAPLDLQFALIIWTSGSCRTLFLTMTIWNITQQDLVDTVRKQKHPTHKNMWQELSNDTTPKEKAIYPSKDKLLSIP